MRTHTRLAVITGAFALLMTSGAMAQGLPNFDAFGSRQPVPSNNAALTQKVVRAGNPAARLQTESRLGVPTFLWLTEVDRASLASKVPVGTETGRPEVAAARAAISANASLYKLSTSDAGSAAVAMVHNTGKGAIVVKFRQQIGGIEIFHEEMNVLMTQQLRVIGISGYISSTSTPAAQGALSFSLPATSVAANAVKDMTRTAVSGTQFVAAGSHDGYEYFNLVDASGVALAEPVRAKKVYFHLPEGLVPAYYVEVIADLPNGGVSLAGPTSSTEGYAYVISAKSGEMLFRKNLSADAEATRKIRVKSDTSPNTFTYKVWVDSTTLIPYDTPAGNAVHPKINPTNDGVQYPFLAPNDIALSNYPFSQNDPWIATGSTETIGNNAEAYANLASSCTPAATCTTDGFGPVAAAPYSHADSTGDFHAQISSTDAFQHLETAGIDPNTAEARQGSIQQLFYNVNFLHDWYYDSGLDEASGNAQTNNFGRGGVGNDSIKAQTDDVAGRNNANMLTPADGGRPRMRMYIFDGYADSYLDVQSPAAAAGRRTIGTGQFGAQVFNMTGQIVQPSPVTGCTAASYTGLSGKIVMVDYQPTATCSIGTKLNNAMAAGASAFVLVYLSTSPDTVVNVTGSLPTFTIPFASISWNGAAAIKTQLAASQTVTVQLRRDAADPDRAGALDNQVVFHEWGHYLSNRLIGNSSGISTQQSAGMGEGWGDFNSMMLTVRQNDTSVASNSNWNGVYALATYATSGGTDGGDNQGYYYGIRRFPYSTDMTKNPLTYKHTQDGTPLPVVTPPASFGASGASNSEVHNTGEVWATMLWECYASLLRDTQGANPRLTYQAAQDRMKGYLVASLKMTPNAPTILEARDAVLAAAYATDLTDYIEFYQAFAKRGAGMGAIAADRFSTNNVGVTESFVTGPEMSYVSSSLGDSVSSCDHDNVVDSGEVGVLTVQLQNTGTTQLNATTATVSSTTTGVSFPNGTTINLPATGPLENTTGSVQVALAAGLSGVQQLDLSISYNADAQLPGGLRTQSLSFRGNTNEIPAASATDTVEAHTTPWSVTSNPVFGPQGPWKRAEAGGPLQHVWHGTDVNGGSDEYLSSPVFTVDGSGSVNVQFDHSWSFEFDGGGNYDGGVIEISVNGGPWTDIGASLYNGTLITYAGNVNPLAGRPALVQSSGGTVHASLTQAIAPGSTVQVRYRVASDGGGASTGWDIDNIAFTGVVETPFAVLVADTGCSLPTTTTLAVSANPSPLGSALTLTATVSSATPVNSGTVTFYDGVTSIGSNAVTGGVATLSVSNLSLGLHNLRADFGGAAGAQPSTSNSIPETIGKAATSVAVVSSLNPSSLGSAVTFTATVTSTSGTPVGSVQFLDGASPLSTIALSGGVAAYTTSSLSGGTHSITASYLGNATYASSANSVSQSVVTGSVISFSPSNYWQREDVTPVALTITRTGGDTTGAATVVYEMIDGTAHDGTRYSSTWGFVSFAPNQTSATLNVDLINDSAIEGMQNFTVVLSAPVGATLGTNTATVNVLDNDTAKGDFSSPSDAKNDLILRNSAGDLRAWLMNGTTFVSSVDLPRLGSGYTMVGTGDFNADGHADLLWQNNTDRSLTIWYMNGTTFLSASAPLSQIPDANTVVSAVGDMDGDGFPDIIVRNTSTFALSVWVMRDTAYLSTATLPTVPDLNWQMVGVGDFNRDGKADLVWKNETQYKTAVWLMNGTTFVSAASLPTTGAPWSLVGVGDMNSDGDTDLIWHASTATGQNAVWLMNQTAFNSAVSLPSDATYAPIAPR